MKNLILLVSVLVSSGLLASAQQTQLIDVESSSVNWLAKKVTGQHNGTIDIKEGQVRLDENGRITGGEFTIDMSTISVDDIENEKMNSKLVGHLNSPDFFDVENHKTAHLIITSVEYGTDGVEVVGDLTIKDKTNEISFSIDLGHLNQENFHATASFDVDRTLYDVRYGSGKFFDNLGDKTIYDKFTLSVELFAKK